MRIARMTLLVSLVALIPDFAYAYIGPGLGAGTVGVVLGVIGSVFIALFAIIWYPLKRILKKNKKPKTQDVEK